MSTPFAALEAKVNASVFKHMPNAEASFTPAGGGLAVEGVAVVFDSAQAVEDEFGVITHRPTLLVSPEAVPGLGQGYTVAIVGAWGTGSYLVRQVLPLAEGGYQRAVLARA